MPSLPAGRNPFTACAPSMPTYPTLPTTTWMHTHHLLPHLPTPPATTAPCLHALLTRFSLHTVLPSSLSSLGGYLCLLPPLFCLGEPGGAGRRGVVGTGRDTVLACLFPANTPMPARAHFHCLLVLLVAMLHTLPTTTYTHTCHQCLQTDPQTCYLPPSCAFHILYDACSLPAAACLPTTPMYHFPTHFSPTTFSAFPTIFHLHCHLPTHLPPPTYTTYHTTTTFLPTYHHLPFPTTHFLPTSISPTIPPPTAYFLPGMVGTCSLSDRTAFACYHHCYCTTPILPFFSTLGFCFHYFVLFTIPTCMLTPFYHLLSACCAFLCVSFVRFSFFLPIPFLPVLFYYYYYSHAIPTTFLPLSLHSSCAYCCLAAFLLPAHAPTTTCPPTTILPLLLFSSCLPFTTFGGLLLPSLPPSSYCFHLLLPFCLEWNSLGGTFGRLQTHLLPTLLPTT